MNVLEYIVSLFQQIWEALKNLGRIIKQKILNFKNNIVKFFQDKSRLQALKKNSELMAVAIKQNLDDGNFNTVNCLFNRETNEVEDLEENGQGYEVEKLDKETVKNFGGKDMIVLQ